jgi:hypothetical protein
MSTDKTERAAFDSLCMWADEAATRLTSENHEVRDRLREAVQRARASLPSQPATVVQPVGTLTVSKFRGHLENTAFDYTGSLPDGTYSLYAHPSAPDESGWQWVPVEPTPEMIAAMSLVECTATCINKFEDGCEEEVPILGMAGSEEAYAAMLKSAPSAAQPGGEGGSRG